MYVHKCTLTGSRRIHCVHGLAVCLVVTPCSLEDRKHGPRTVDNHVQDYMMSQLET
jgi:hypothetical protein